MRNCNIKINNDGSVAVSNFSGYIEEHGATTLVITLSDELKSDAFSYYTLCFKPGAALKNPPNIKITTDMITADTTTGTAVDGVISYPLPYELTRFGSLDVQVQAHVLGEDDSLATTVKSPVFRLSFEPSVTGEEAIMIKDTDGFIDLIHTALAQLNATVEETNELCDKINTALENGEFNGEKGEKGDKGDKGDTGDKGADATVNGFNAVTLKAGGNLSIAQDGSTLTLSIESVPVYSTLPDDAANGDICLYAPANTLTPENSGARICFDWDKFLSAINENTSFDVQLFSDSEQTGGISVSVVWTQDLSDFERGIYLTKGNEEWFVNFHNSEFDSASSYHSLDGEYEPLTQPPTHFDLPEFDTVQTEQSDVNGELFFVMYRLMAYFGEWTELSTSSHTHSNIEVLEKITQEMLDGCGGIPTVHTLPSEAEDGELVLYAPMNTLTLEDSGKRICFDWEEFAKPIAGDEAQGSGCGWYADGSMSFELQAERGADSNNFLNFVLYQSDGVIHNYHFSWTEGVFDSEFSVYEYTDASGEIIITSFSSVDELPLYLELPKFDSLEFEFNSEAEGVFMFCTESRLMAYQGGEWHEAVSSADVLTDRIEVAEGAATLQPNRHYVFGEVESLMIGFADGNAEKRNEYSFTFVSGETPTVLTLPASVQWASELTVEANKRYEISIVDDIGLWTCVDYTAEVTE